ncbi:MAG: UDP-N-acetylmuramate dehydrogenase [Wenzhouxiangellaceae bacterium]|nr:UDP-N-acetylmuramate dehydrogenase [Wenzhouxiangellaceae bacterium]
MNAEIERNVSLERFSTFRLPARARELARLDEADDLPGLLDTDLPVMLIGGGSNTVFIGDFDGRIVVNRLRGIDSEIIDRDRVVVTAMAGEDWHGLVRWSLDRGLWGIENLAMIPGLVGAAPMQNIGAYGVELAHCLEAVQAFDRESGRVEWLPASECGLDYRDSRFKSRDAGRFVILAIRLELKLDGMPVIEYPSLAAELKRHGHAQPDDPRTVAAAVMRERRRKLPDPDLIANAGSFFKNPVLKNAEARPLIEQYPELPNWPDKPGFTKLSAAWLIDQLGWRGKSVGDCAVYERHALVLVNRGRATGADVVELAGRIRESVRENFGIALEPEPILVGAGSTQGV